MRDKIPLEKEEIPYSYDIALGERVYTLEYMYNARHDFFSVNLSLNGAYVCTGERLVYGKPLFADVYMPDLYPPITIVPWDESGTVDVVNWETMGNSVFLTIDDGEGSHGAETD